MDINTLIEATKKQAAIRQSVLDYCEENITLGMSETQVTDILRSVGIIGNSKVSREDVEQSFLSNISSNVFNYNQPLDEFHFLMRLIEEHLDWILEFNKA